MRLRRRLRMLALLAGLAAATSTSLPSASAQETDPANVAAARRHFDKARAEYAQGSYREAIGELEAAHSLDPQAKDLVFNLGVVHEKLSDIDDALKWFQLYTTMNLTPQERDRADAYIRRLEGAKKELPRQPAPTDVTGQTSAESLSGLRTSPSPPGSPGRGRLDAATIVAVSVAGAAFTVGTVMAIKAKVDQPSSSFVTGQNGTYADLKSSTDSAHREAVIADVGFATAIAAGVTAAVLYFARTRDPGTTPAPSLSVSAAAVTGGGALVVQGFL